MKKIISILTILLILAFPSLTLAQSSFPTWDYDVQRTATSQSDSNADPWTALQSSGQVVSYAGKPITVHIPQLNEGYAPDPVTGIVPKAGTYTFSQYSSTTAVTDASGSTMYQYTWDDGGWGHVWKYSIQPGDLAEGNTITLPQSALVKTFPCGGNGFQNGAWVTNFADAPSGVTISDDGNWMAVGAGAKLYWWPMGNPGAMLKRDITGNDPNDICSASPLITPNGYIMVGDFNGGFISTDLSGMNYQTTSTSSDLGSGDPSESITSSPAWNPISNTAWFGIASTSAPRLISYNPSNNTSTIVGKGTITGPVWSPTPIDSISGDVFNTDWGGNAYRWNSSGASIQKWMTPQGAGHVISNMAMAKDNSGYNHLAWVDMNGQVNNTISPSGSYWVETSKTKNVMSAIDPSFVRSLTGDYLGEAFIDQSDGSIYYSYEPIASTSTAQHTYTPLNQGQKGIVGSWLNVVYDASIGPIGSPSNYTSYTWSDDANGSPGIVIYLLSPVSLKMDANGPTGYATAIAPSTATLTGRPGDTETITMTTPGLGLLDPGTYSGVIHVTGFPDGSSKDIPPAPYSYGGSGGIDPTFAPVSVTLPKSTVDYTLTLTETLMDNGVATSYPSPTITISVPVVGVASAGNLTMSTFRDGNINNLGTNAGGHPNLVTGNPLKFNFGDTMLADLVVPTPPPPAGWQYESSSLNGTITYPINTPKPTGTAQIVNNRTDASIKTVSFSTNTRAGSQENGVSINDSVASFPVEWPTWFPPLQIPGQALRWDWNSAQTPVIKATWEQTGSYKKWVTTKTGGYWATQSFDFHGVSFPQELQRTGTDIYCMAVAREPWMR